MSATKTGTPYDAAVIGAGPAGVAAADLLSSRGIRTVLIGERFGGPPGKPDSRRDWLAPVLRGTALAKAAKAHLAGVPSLTVRLGSRVSAIRREQRGFAVETDGGGDSEDSGDAYRTRVVLIATGTSPKRLDIPGEQPLSDRGVSYCIVCDAPYFAGKRVVVICDEADGGEETVEGLAELRKHARTVTLITDPGTVRAIEGDRRVKAVRVRKGGKGRQGGKDVELKTDGVFVQLGRSPNTGPFRDLLKLDKAGHVPADPGSGATKVPGVFAAGDVTGGPYPSARVAFGEGTRAALALAEYLSRDSERKRG
ncbi:MAG: FAD-dependent oxidoreductase [bacterium]|nr:FAD-dependent oxidoreductase [bacterium]MDZ4248172.1 FAD-dependent oxidoreductase [Patescibacteria group bacterium]